MSYGRGSNSRRIEVTATLCAALTTRNIARVVDILNKDRYIITELAKRISEKLPDVVKEAMREAGVPEPTDKLVGTALALLAAARIYLYLLNEEINGDGKPENIMDMVKRLPEIRDAVEKIEAAWFHSVDVVIQRPSRDKPLSAYM